MTISSVQAALPRFAEGTGVGSDRPRGLLIGIVRVVGAAREGYRIRQDMRQLMALSDHLLEDIGVARDRIGHALGHNRHG